MAEETINELGQSMFSLNEIGIFLLVGFVAMISLYFIFRTIQSDRIEKITKKIHKKQREYWKENFLPETTEYILLFYRDLKSLLTTYYKEEGQNEINQFEKRIETLKEQPLEISISNHLDVQGNENFVIKFIGNMLPHYHPESNNISISLTKDNYEKLKKKTPHLWSLSKYINKLIKESK